MRKPRQLSDLNWHRLQAFANPLEDELNDALAKVLTLAEHHLDCPGPSFVAQVLDRASDLANTLQVTLEDTRESGPHPTEPQAELPDPEQPEDEDHPPRRTRAQLRDAILQYLQARGGEATSAAIYHHVQHGMLPPLCPEDLAPLSNRTPRWRRDTDRARRSLVTRELIQRGNTPMTWALTTQGTAHLRDPEDPGQKQPGPEPNPNPSVFTTPEPDTPEPAPSPDTQGDSSARAQSNPIATEIPSRRRRHTPQSHYRLPILYYLSQQGGSAKTQEVIAHIGRTMADSFNTADLRPTPGGEPRWHSIVNNARLQLARNDLLRTDSPTGTWEISQQGWDHLQQDQEPQ